MNRNVKIQRFEIYGDIVSMGNIIDMILEPAGKNKYRCTDDNIWKKKGPMYIREGGNEHGFMILEEYDYNSDSDSDEFD